MALDRQSIEKKDFPIGRRGYDPEAVDVHLSSLADEIAEIKRSARRRSDTLASSASDQVRAIVEAAENSAADIQREAETEAREIREEASSEARATREKATEEARDYVGRVSESTASMLQRIDAMESELATLVDTLRTGGNRLDSDLRLLEDNLRDVGEAVSPRHQFEPDDEQVSSGSASAETAGEAHAPPEPEAVDGSDVDLDAEEPVVEGEIVSDGSEADSDTAPQAETEDAEGARLIALNMALNGTPRDETAKYLSENFSLADSDGLLDEVYASVDG